MSTTGILLTVDSQSSTTQLATDSKELLGHQREPWVDILINVILWSLCAFTVIGNALVLIAFAVDSRVRSKVSNLYILNLSIADFIVGCMSIPLYNVYIHRGIWPFGEVVCKFWISMDFSACSVSVYGIVLISYDRFMLITKGLDYDKHQTKIKFLILAGTCWGVSIFRNALAYCGYDVWNESAVDYDIVCDSPLLSSVPYMTYECVISFFIPVTLTTYFNVTLYLDIRRRSRIVPGSRRTNTTNTTRPASILVEPAQTSTIGSGPHSSSDNLQDSSSPHHREGTRDIRKHRKAAVTLGLIVAVSTTCWAIYFSITITNAVFQADIGNALNVASYYVYYANSAINPLLYVATNPNIRRGIARILFLKRK
ncbi:histamine H4 receptor-like [Amphiura filiformis]|uniref:histamine H4 receptor-like n=1 Tax=Amphiura filiformis TaxID=82378 RepID=UPI003B210651